MSAPCDECGHSIDDHTNADNQFDTRCWHDLDADLVDGTFVKCGGCDCPEYVDPEHVESTPPARIPAGAPPLSVQVAEAAPAAKARYAGATK